VSVRTLKLAAKCLLNYRGVRREHARRLFFRLARRFTPALACDAAGLRYYVNTADDCISEDVFATGGYDREVIDRALEALEAAGRAPETASHFVDIGANIGTNVVGLVGGRRFARGIAFEPEPLNFLLLRQNILANGLEERVAAHNMALSDREGELVLELDPHSTGNHAVRARAEVPGVVTAERGKAETISIPSRTIDRLAATGTLDLARVGLVWIDTQGHEAHVLRGAASLAAAGVPVVVEYWPFGLQAAGQMEAFEQVVAAQYNRYLDLRRAPVQWATTADLPDLRSRYPGRAYSDLLLFPR
jgi:FkbM family methyltransferase